MARVVITGAGGFLGRGLCRWLAGVGHESVALTRRHADVTDAAALRARAAAADAVVHLACPTSAAARRAQPFETLREVLHGTVNALGLALDCGAGHLVLASSGKVYGPAQRLPVREDHPLAPDTQLGDLKRLAEAVLQSGVRTVAGAGGPGVTALRLFNVYGPGQPDGFLVPHLLAALRRGGPVRIGELDHHRDWLHVDDACTAFLTALEHPAPAGRLRALNVGSGRTATAREVLERLAALAGVTPEVVQEPARMRPGEAAVERADVGRLRELGWAPRIALAEGLTALWEGREPRP